MLAVCNICFVFVRVFILCIFFFIHLLNCSPSKKFIEPIFSFPLISQGKAGKKMPVSERVNINSLPSHVSYLIVNFFSPNCPPCIEELPDINKLHLYTKKKNKEVFLLTLGSSLDAIDTQEDQTVESILPDLNQFIAEHSISYPVHVADSKIIRSFGVMGFPETYIFFSPVLQSHKSPSQKKSIHDFGLIKKIISSIHFEEIKEYIEDRV